MAKLERPRSAISVKGLSKRFGTKQALTNVSFEVPYGSVFGFLGPNGAGKTTTIRCLMDFIAPNAGSISILNHDAHSDSTHLKSLIGYLSSDSQLNPNWTGDDHISFFENIKGKSKNRAQLVKRLGLDTKTKVKALSSGNKQKLAVVLSFVGDPQILVMDEPTRGLDPLLQNELYSILTQFVSNNKTVFLSSHNLGEVERICDTVMLIKDGHIVEEKSMTDIRDMTVHMITAATNKKFDLAKLRALPNTDIVSSSPGSVALKVKGDLNPTLNTLLSAGLTDISVAHASLEDIFLEHYRG